MLTIVTMPIKDKSSIAAIGKTTSAAMNLQIGLDGMHPLLVCFS